MDNSKLFQLNNKFTPRGDQATAIQTLVNSLNAGNQHQTLLGVTGSGKTYTMAAVIAKLQRPALIFAHNKTLASQLCQEFREFFPDNKVEYFVSYYDYYQPEAYIPQTDTFIEKDSAINDEIDRLRHAATQSVLERRDTVIIASVSCIYGLGDPEEYVAQMLSFQVGEQYNFDNVLKHLVKMQFKRNDFTNERGSFRVRGDVVDITPADDDTCIRIEFFGDDLERIVTLNPVTGEVIDVLDQVSIYPATHYVTPWDRMDGIIKEVRQEMELQERLFEEQNKLIEAQRIRQRTEFDIEMMKEIGYCSGIENYSRYFDGRKAGERPYTLLDYFPKDFLMFIDESHQTVPQIRGMYNGDRSRKTMLVNYGFRLPSALDNRPLRYDEFEKLTHQIVYVSATPGPLENSLSKVTAEQLIRPTGLIDPEVIVRPVKGQIDDLVNEIQLHSEVGERVLVTTLTKKMSEELTQYFEELGLKVNYLHSDVDTIGRQEILRDLRLGVYDVVIGINLLREGLDLPEVSMVAILDADKEGFLRSETALVQTIGRAARHINGQVILYADHITGSMERAIRETNRRRVIQQKYNQDNNIVPESIVKAVRDVVRFDKAAESHTTYNIKPTLGEHATPEDIHLAIADMERDMKAAAKSLEFEKAAELRDEINRLKKMIPNDPRYKR
ncbi:MAG: excinuclease ABC subunit UvrB [Armatimonadota bacterium]